MNFIAAFSTDLKQQKSRFFTPTEIIFLEAFFSSFRKLRSSPRPI
jgi:hypothetical protein